MINVVLVLVALGLFAYVITKDRDKIRQVFDRQIDWRLLAVAQALFLVSVTSTFVRWYFLVRVIEPRFTLRPAVLLGFIGNTFNLVIPGAVGGDLIKAAYLVRMNIKKTQAVASMVIDRIVGLLGLFVLASIAGLFAWSDATGEVRTLIMLAWAATATGFVVLAVIFAQLVTRFFPQVANPQAHSKLSLIASELHTMSSTYRRRLGVVLGCLLMAMMNHSINVIAFFVVGMMLFPDMTTTLAQHFLMVPLSLFTMAVPIPFGALGFAEGVSDRLLALVGHPSGSLAMIGFRVVMFGSALVGIVVYVIKLKEFRALTASAHELEDEMLEGDLTDQPQPA